MQRRSRREGFSIPFESFSTGKKGSRKGRALFLQNAGSDSVESDSHASHKPVANQIPRLPQDVARSRLTRTRISGNVGRSETGVASGRLRLKSPRTRGGKSPTLRKSLLSREASSFVVKDAIFQRGHLTPQFASVLVGKGHIRRKVTMPSARRFLANSSESHRLPHVEQLKLLRALLKEQSTFLELRGRFGVSKQAMRRFVKNRLLVEVWGPNAVGVRYKLSKKGEAYLRKLEAAANYEPRIKKKDIVQLKHMVYP